MPTLHLQQLEPGEKLPHDRQHLVRHVPAPRAAHHQRRPFEARRAGVLEREVRHVGQRLRQRGERDAEAEVDAILPVPFSVGRPDEVREQELPDPQIPFVLLQNVIRLPHAPYGGVFFLDLPQAAHVGVEIALQRRVDGRVVHGHEGGVVFGAAQGEGHGDFGAHAVAYEDGGGEGVGCDEVFYVGGHGGVGVCWAVGGGAVVA